ncbi:MAG TPA: heme exporter protein CcmD [Caulobacteraceae bacterium]|nr:heme exporter protein CcmD [Caulobacteraceae bacterium]
MHELARFGGRYALFVLGAYGVAALLFVVMIADTLARAARHRRNARRQDERR